MGALRELITETLQVRFGDAPRAVRDHLDATKALPELKALHRIALTCKNLAEFKRASDDLKKTIEDEIEQGKHEADAVKKQVAEVRSTFDAPAAPVTAPSEGAPAVPSGPAPQGPAPQGSVPRADSPIRPV